MYRNRNNNNIRVGVFDVTNANYISHMYTYLFIVFAERLCVIFYTFVVNRFTNYYFNQVEMMTICFNETKTFLIRVHVIVSCVLAEINFGSLTTSHATDFAVSCSGASGIFSYFFSRSKTISFDSPRTQCSGYLRRLL